MCIEVYTFYAVYMNRGSFNPYVTVNIRLTFHILILCNDILHIMFLVIVCMFYFISYSMID